MRACVVAVAVALVAIPARADRVADVLSAARGSFEYGDFAKTVKLLEDVADRGLFASEADRVETYRLLGLSFFYLHKKDESDVARRHGAQEAFFDLLKQDPDYQLDPFYVPPEAVAFFDLVRKENEPYLAPIRDRRNARLREQALEDQARREAERLRRETRAAQVAPVVIERQLVQNSLVLAAMPFGLGQFQNGHRTAGNWLLGGQAVTATTSGLMYVLIESLRGDDHRFASGAVYSAAKRFEIAKFVSAGVFYALWLGGAIEANLHFVPSRVLSETTRAPSAAPEGPLPPPSPVPPPVEVVPAPVDPPRLEPLAPPALETAPMPAPPAPAALPHLEPTLTPPPRPPSSATDQPSDAEGAGARQSAPDKSL